MALMEKPGPEYGVVLRLSDGRVEPGDKFEGDFSSIDRSARSRTSRPAKRS